VAYGLAEGQPMPVTWSAVVQLFLMALRAAQDQPKAALTSAGCTSE
jgi:hypothetical protein